MHIDPTFEEFTKAARSTCRIIEQLQLPRDEQKLLMELVQLLRCAVEVAQTKLDAKGQEVEFESYSGQLEHIPEDIVFHVVFDPSDPASVCEITLRDSLEDIYESLKAGLKILDLHPDALSAVFWQWKFDFEQHWNRHLIDTIRFLLLAK